MSEQHIDLPQSGEDCIEPGRYISDCAEGRASAEMTTADGTFPYCYRELPFSSRTHGPHKVGWMRVPDHYIE